MTKTTGGVFTPARRRDHAVRHAEDNPSRSTEQRELGHVDLYSAAGIAGFVLYVVAYGSVQLERLDGNSVAYATANIVAASLVLVSLSSDFNLASALIQITWISLGLIGLVLRWTTPSRRLPEARRLA